MHSLKEELPHGQLWRSWKEYKDPSSGEKLIQRYLPLVNQVANQMGIALPKRVFSREDVISLGRVGLVEAIHHFDYRKGNKFETYALWRIRGAILDGMRKQDWFPRNTRSKLKRLNQATKVLEQRLMRTPTEEELGEYLGISKDEVEAILSTVSFSTLLSLDEPINVGEDDKLLTLIENIPDQRSQSQQKITEMKEVKQILMEFIEELSDREKTVISLCYWDELSLSEIAATLNLTRSRISQLHTKAILRLREKLQKEGYDVL